jgi:RHS repeat-associated protein
MSKHLARRSARLALALLAACDLDAEPGPTALFPAAPGLPRFQAAAAVAVPGGIVNVAGGNLLVHRVDLSIDTKLGTQEVGAVYNSKTRRWRFGFDLRYDGATFVDGSGSVHDRLWSVPSQGLLPGTVWIKLDGSRLQSVGGLVHEFDADGRLAAVRWVSDPYPRLEYPKQEIAGRPRIVAIVQCSAPGACASVVTIARDAAGRVLGITDRAGRTVELAYDANGWLASARDPLDVERGLPGTRYEYRDDQRLFARTSSEGERVEYATHWNQGRTTEVRALGAEGAVHRFEYASDADPYAPHTTVHVDPLGQRTLYRYDGARRLRRVVLPTGETISREWSGFEVARLVEPGGVTTSFEHVDADEVIRTEPSGNVVQIDFRLGAGENRAAPFERPIERIDDSLGLVERRGYDARGRLAWVENGAGERTSFTWSSANLLERETRPDGIATRYADYGEHGHAGTVVSGGEVATRSFDAVGNAVATSGLGRLDRRPGGEIERRYDGDRNLAELVLADAPPGEAVVRISWRSDGRMLRIERPGGGDHELEYDALGRLVARHERSGGAVATTRFEVDALGRTVAETLPNGMRREWTFDAAGRTIGLVARRDGALEGELALAWADGRLASADDSLAGGVETYAWDAAGELAAVAFPGGERLELEHDLRGRRTLETYRLADGSVLREIAWAHDAADRPIRIEEDGALLVQHAWADGRLASTGFGSGLVRSYDYDPVTGLLAAATSAGPGGAVVEETSLATELDPAGGLRVVAETASAGPAAAWTREEYALGATAGEGRRLVAWSDGGAERPHASDPLANATLAGGESLLYDAEGSRLLARVDAASGAPIADYAYDAAGFCVMRGGVPLAWTALGRIAAIGDLAELAWDLQGRPLRRRVAGEEVHFRFGGRVETDAAGTPLRLDLGAVALRLDTGERRYRHVDFRGNVKLESDDAGAPVLHLRYAPYGVDASFGAGDGAATFAGGRELGPLLLIGARLLDPAAGRFLAPDPVLQLVNQYAYTPANPVAFWDPDGREWKLSGFLYGAAGAVGGGVVGSAAGAAAGSAIVGGVIGGPIGAVLGVAVAELIFQQLNPGEHGPFGLEDIAELATPLYIAPPARPDCGCETSEGRGRASVPAPDPGGQPAASSVGGTPGFSGFRWSAWGAGGVSGAVGGGFSGF